MPTDSDWTRIPLATTENLTSVAARQLNDARLSIVGDNGTCFRWTQISARTEPCMLPLGSNAPFTGVSLSLDRVVAVSGAGGVFVYAPAPGVPQTDWVAVTGAPANAEFRTVATSANDAFVFGSAGAAYVFGLGDRPPRLTALKGFPADLSAHSADYVTIAGSAKADQLFVVGAAGQIARWSKETLKPATVASETSGVTIDLNGVLAFWNLQGTELRAVAVGDGGVILTRDAAGKWVKEDSGTTQNLYGVFGTANGVYAVGANGTILSQKQSGAPWTAQKSGVTVALRGGVSRVANVSLTHFIVGDQGTFLTRMQ